MTATQPQQQTQATTTPATPTTAAAATPSFWVHTLAFKNKLRVPKKLVANATIADTRRWIADKLHFPVDEAQLIANGKRLADTTQLTDLGEEASHLYLVCRPTDVKDGKSIKIFINDTSRVPSKMLAVKMHPSQTVAELKEKVFNKSSCTVPPRFQVLNCRGRNVSDGIFTLREYTISQRTDRIVFALSKDPAAVEDLDLVIKLPSNNVTVKSTMPADSNVENLRQMLKRSYGIDSARYSLMNIAGLVLQDEMSIREACTMPVAVPNLLLSATGSVAAPPKPTLNMTLFAVPIPHNHIARGAKGFHVYLNPQHHAALGIVDDQASNSSTSSTSSSRKTTRRPKRAKAGQKCQAGSALKGFRGLFTNKTNRKAKSVAAAADDSSSSASTTDDEGEQQSKANQEPQQQQQHKKKKRKNTFKRRMKAMMRANRFASREDEVAHYREHLGRSLGGGDFKRVDSI